LPPPVGQRIHRNLEEIEVWGDGCHVRSRHTGYQHSPTDPTFEGHHFGEVRKAARLREKWRAQARRHKKISKRDWIPSFVYDLLPHRWCDPTILPRLRVYEGPLISAVRDDPQEFVRDGFQTYRWAQKQQTQNTSPAAQLEHNLE
jgi:hypothetical protein